MQMVEQIKDGEPGRKDPYLVDYLRVNIPEASIGLTQLLIHTTLIPMVGEAYGVV
jgi:hypothetical protein